MNTIEAMVLFGGLVVWVFASAALCEVWGWGGTGSVSLGERLFIWGSLLGIFLGLFFWVF
jgi:hypothetical protein